MNISTDHLNRCVEARDWARLPESFCREIERDYVVLVER